MATRAGNGFLRRYMSLRDLKDALTHQRLRLSSPGRWVDKNDARFLSEFAKRTGVPVHALCLTLAGETVHHWQTYAANGKGACLELNAGKFLPALDKASPGDAQSLLHGPVKYVKHQQLPITIADARLPFIKRYGFRDEREYRVIFSGPSLPGERRPALPLDYAWISAIYLGDGFSRAQRDRYAMEFRELTGNPQLRVHRTTLFENPEWIRRVS